MNKISCVEVVYHQFQSSRMKELRRLLLFLEDYMVGIRGLTKPMSTHIKYRVIH